MIRVNLFCLPFAGGSSYSYRIFEKQASDFLKIIPIELPGRGKRSGENLLTSIDEMVSDVFGQIAGRLNEPYAIFGHSMGTLIGYELTREILKQNLLNPIHLFFTGSGGPGCKEYDSFKHLLPRDEFFSEINKYGGITPEVLNSIELMNFFEPVLRSDFQATETYKHHKSEPFNIPITCMIGLEEKTTKEQAMEWQFETKIKLKVIPFPGNHFFIFNNGPRIVQTIEQVLFEKDMKLV